jgi:hypothetical protein
MATPTEIRAVAEVLADPANASASADEVAEKVWAVVDRQRRRRFRYVVLAQARRGPSQGRTGYFPTWVRGPYYTASEAHSGAQEERARLEAMGFTVNNKNGDAAVMAAELFDVDVPIDPATLKEVIL